MNDNQNWNSTGEQIKGAVNDALQTGDFKNLNRLVSQTVANALGEVGKQISSNYSGSPYGGQGHAESHAESHSEDGFSSAQAHAQSGAPVWQQRMQEKQAQMQQHWQQQLRHRQEQIRRQEASLNRQEAQLRQRQAQLQKNNSPVVAKVKFKKIGGVSNVLYQVFGGIGLGITCLITFIRTLVMIYGETTPQGWLVNLIFLTLFFGMIQLGLSQRRRIKRAQRYVQLCDYRVHGEIKKLANATGKSERYVLKDLQKMLRLGMFPEGHLDQEQTCFMLTDTVYHQYLEACEGRRLREEESKMNQAQAAPEVTVEEASELDTMIAEGKEFIRKLRDLNDRIPGEVISAKLFCMESLLKDIFDSVKEHPEQMQRMHKLMSYYLPTTLKLVESYEEFDRISSPGSDILEAKAEIENTLDTINQAFRELLNNLFQSAAFDATTDAQVLKTMLAKEGLTREMEYVTVGRDS